MAGVLNRRVFAAVVVVVAAAIFLPPYINVNRFRPRIAGALSKALGREVTIGNVELRLLPTPGLTLQRVVVEDDPDFSPEPMLRADEVVASLRLLSLWRGRLEIARLTFDAPSLNLVRRPDGHWNLESLLERARQTPVAPTTLRRAEERKRFPYIESNGGRVNLKLGQEKTVWALTDADFALWLEREDEWNLRLAARAIRTDANLQDTGTVKVSGTVRRAASLSETPVDLKASLVGAQLGQLSTLLYGRDRGWRGTVNATIALKGAPTSLAVQGDASVEDFRRYDIVTGGNMRLATSCSAKFSSTARQVSDMLCHSAVGDGFVDVRGQVSGVAPASAYQLSVTAREVPAAALAVLVRHMKKDLPEDVAAVGSVNGNFSVTRDAGAEAEWSGAGVATSFALNSRLLEKSIDIGEVHFGLRPLAAPRMASKRGSFRPARGERIPATLMPSLPGADALVIDPFSLDLGGQAAARAQGTISRAGYTFAIKGDAELKRLLQVSEALGVAAPRFSPAGNASLDLSLAGAWAGFAQPLVTGTASVKATAPVNGIGMPVQVTSAKLTFSENGILADDLVFGWPQAHVIFAGTLTIPRRCTTAETCPVQFQLHSDALNSEDAAALLNPAKRPWYAFFSSASTHSPVLMRLIGQGRVSVGTLTVHGVTVRNASGQVALNRGAIAINHFAGAAFAGTLTGGLRADLGASPPKYATSGTLQNASVATMSAPILLPVRRNEAGPEAVANRRPAAAASWGTGKLDATFTLNAAGRDFASVLGSAAGTIQYAWRDGTVALALDGRGAPLHIADFRGSASLKNGVFTFAPSKMKTGDGIYTVSGTASLDRKLGLTFSRGETPVYGIGGTLERPQVSATLDPAASVPRAETRAKLKQ